MQPQDVNTIEDCRKIIEKLNVSTIQIALCDLHGILRGKYISTKKFLASLEKGFSFCDVILGLDVDDTLIDGLNVTGWHSGYPDAVATVVPNSCRSLPYADNVLFFQGEFSPPKDALCARTILRKVIQQANEMGFYPFAGMEFEFSAFSEDSLSLQEKNFQSLDSMTLGNFGYSILRIGSHSEFHNGLLRFCADMAIPLECLHTEIGPGVLEAALQATDALRAADNAVLFKTVSKIYAAQQHIILNFMAKWSLKHQGQSGHIHMSLNNAQGENVFYDENQPNNMSQTMQYFLAGQQRLMPELLVMSASNVNSFVRLQPGYWAPTAATWGFDNRTCALRVIRGSKTAQRIEYRITGADANPYLAFAAALASGLYGITHQLELTAPIKGNSYAQKHDQSMRLPRTLGEATDKFEKSSIAKELFGAEFVKDFSTICRFEQEQSDKQVTDWQLKRYFEII